MDEPVQEMPFLKNIGLLMTYQCQVSCPHCIIEAGPNRKEHMVYEDTCNWIDQIAAYRNGHIKVMSLTGGEPFIDIQFLKKISELAEARGLFVSAVTNAHWASDPDRALSILRDLPAIKMIQVSTDVYHQKNIPYANVCNAVHAAEKCQVPCTVAVCTDNSMDPGYLRIMHELSTLVDPQLIYTAITFRAGRALKSGNGHNYETSIEPPVSACGAGSAPIIFPDGRIVACIGPIIELSKHHPLIFGNLHKETLADILDKAEINPILHAIRLWGPKHFIQMLERAGYKSILPAEYIKDSVCHACYELMANPEIVAFFESIKQDFAFIRKVAYGRIYYLRETYMVQRLGLQG